MGGWVVGAEGITSGTAVAAAIMGFGVAMLAVVLARWAIRDIRRFGSREE